MQAEMLDTVVSSNSQELSDASASSAIKLFANPQFRVRVIMRCSEPWFVASDACDCLAISNARDALANIDDDDKLKLTKDEIDTVVSIDGIKCSVDSRVQSLNLVSESGLYDLIMQSRKPEAKAFKRWVTHEVIPSIRKTGSYSVVQPTLAIPKTLPEALRAYADEVERREAAEKRAITAESERDEAIRTKAMIGSNREATAMNTASQKSKECARLTSENEELKDAVGRGNNWRTVSVMKAEWKRKFGHEPSWYQLKKLSADLPKEMQPIKDVEEKVVLRNGSEKVRLVNRYHIEAWDRYRQCEETIRVTGAQTKNA